MGNVVNQEGFTRKDWVSAAAGLGLGTAVTTVFVLCSGSLLAKVVRPWKIADEYLQAQKQRWSEVSGRQVDDGFFENYQSKDDPDGDILIDDAEEAGFGPLGMPLVAQKLCQSGLTLEMLQRVNNEVLLDQLLQGSGVDKAGDRLRVILSIRDAKVVSADQKGIDQSEDSLGAPITLTPIASGDMDSSFRELWNAN
mmetsp:Transcript_25109/g.60429  ORF Transcript_25109/g.60429 Transcript_25109/m.60429 type:complete len:196 (+) Transcript_25109:613-1200(+)